MKLRDLKNICKLTRCDIIGMRGWRFSAAFITAWRQLGPLEALFGHRVATHIAIYSGRNHIIEATVPRIREIRADAHSDNVIFVFRPQAVRDPDAMMAWLRAQRGKKYDVAAWGAQYGIGAQDPRRWYCSELAGAALAEGGYAIPPEWRIRCFPLDIQLHAEACGGIIYRAYKKWWR